MITSTKPYRIITIFSSFQSYEKMLKDLGLEFTKRDVLQNFWGVEFTFPKPMGKGAATRRRLIDRL
jgi:hypothetical protein